MNAKTIDDFSGMLRPFLSNRMEDKTEASKAISGRIFLQTVDREEISEAEARIGEPIPEPLRELWLKIGAGILKSCIDGTMAEEEYSETFRFMSPMEMADLLLGEGDYLDLDWEFPGLPFSDIGDACYLSMSNDGSS